MNSYSTKLSLCSHAFVPCCSALLVLQQLHILSLALKTGVGLSTTQGCSWVWAESWDCLAQLLLDYRRLSFLIFSSGSVVLKKQQQSQHYHQQHLQQQREHQGGHHVLHSGQEYQQQQSRQSHHGHHNNHQKMSSEVGSGSRHKQPRVGSLSHELLDSSHTPTKFSADNSAISSVVTSPTSSVRSKRMQHHQRPQIPAASVAASMASAAVVPSSSSMQQPQVPIGMTTSYGKKCFRILYFWLG